MKPSNDSSSPLPGHNGHLSGKPSDHTERHVARISRQDPGERLVLVLDDDQAILDGVERLLGGRGYNVRTFSCSAALLDAGPPAVPSCLILDNQLGDGATGLEIHAEIQRLGWNVATVFLTAHWNVQSIVKAIRDGADGFLTKPFDPEELVEAVDNALNRANTLRADARARAAARTRAAQLTDREREIVRLVVAGMLNKEIADELRLALVTVKVHRGRAMRKLGAGNAAELAHLAAMAGIVENRERPFGS